MQIGGELGDPVVAQQKICAHELGHDMVIAGMLMVQSAANLSIARCRIVWPLLTPIQQENLFRMDNAKKFVHGIDASSRCAVHDI